MDVSEFRLRFNLHPLSKHHPLTPTPLASHTALRKAAVLVPVIEINGELHLLLTQRPTHLRAHPGQISFPGGKVEESDSSISMTALREAEEEIGLMRDNVEVIGVFPAHNTFTGFEITPIVGVIKSPFELVLDPGEVADCFTVPLSFLMQTENRHQRRFVRKGQDHTVFFIPYHDGNQERFIWGATAAIIDLFCRHLAIVD